MGDLGRPSTYTRELAARICDDISHGKSVRQICGAGDMPACSTLYKWLIEHDDFSEQYARAREVQAESFADEIVDIADEQPTTVVGKTGKGEDAAEIWGIDSAGIQRNRLRVDARKWVISKLLPKKYGDFQRQEISGPDGGPVKYEPSNLSHLSTEELQALESLARKLTAPERNSGGVDTSQAE